MASDQIRLDKKQWSELLKAERTLSDQFSEMDKAEECGIDCIELREFARQQLELIQTLKKNYGPKS